MGSHEGMDMRDECMHFRFFLFLKSCCTFLPRLGARGKPLLGGRRMGNGSAGVVDVRLELRFT